MKDLLICFAFAIVSLAFLRPVRASCQIETVAGEDTCHFFYWLHGSCGPFSVESSGCWLDISQELLDTYNAYAKFSNSDTYDDNHICCATSSDDCCDPNVGLIAGLVITFVVFLSASIALCCYCCSCCPFYKTNNPPPAAPAQTGMVVMGQPTLAQPAQPYGVQEQYAVQEGIPLANCQQQQPTA
ncbi:hypothetical protein CYMTET_40062 [Cymbomonas tetramitiformis]|uniref:Uncharacterized protein n=1 Tax=Cymbomonas tetramitiformis TaxID=36881 RepID=A0AAE0C8T1_9CHLO|nr:hypothetical protein CYMTET_40062 [Cymbomonas tetramitiformis]